MNRYKKEEQSKRQESRTGLTPEQIRKLDDHEAEEQRIMERARELHAELFDEEYSFMCADTFGEPKLSIEEIVRKNEYRLKHDLPLLDSDRKSGEFQGATLQHCIELAREESK